MGYVLHIHSCHIIWYTSHFTAQAFRKKTVTSVKYKKHEDSSQPDQMWSAVGQDSTPCFLDWAELTVIVDSICYHLIGHHPGHQPFQHQGGRIIFL